MWQNQGYSPDNFSSSWSVILGQYRGSNWFFPRPSAGGLAIRIWTTPLFVSELALRPLFRGLGNIGRDLCPFCKGEAVLLCSSKAPPENGIMKFGVPKVILKDGWVNDSCISLPSNNCLLLSDLANVTDPTDGWVTLEKPVPTWDAFASPVWDWGKRFGALSSAILHNCISFPSLTLSLTNFFSKGLDNESPALFNVNEPNPLGISPLQICVKRIIKVCVKHVVWQSYNLLLFYWHW